MRRFDIALSIVLSHVFTSSPNHYYDLLLELPSMIFEAGVLIGPNPYVFRFYPINTPYYYFKNYTRVVKEGTIVQRIQNILPTPCLKVNPNLIISVI